jgi:hypothetical protein
MIARCFLSSAGLLQTRLFYSLSCHGPLLRDLGKSV